MYECGFDMKKAKYLVILKDSYFKYKNNIHTYDNRVYMDRKYGIYTYTLEDAKSFLFKEMLDYYRKYNLKINNMYWNIQKLKDVFDKYKIYELTSETEIKLNLDIPCDIYYIPNLRERLPLQEKPLVINAYDMILKIISWNGYNKHKIKYFYPVLKFDNEKEHFQSTYRERYHRRSHYNFRISKREKIAGSDPEYKCYLTARQRDRESVQNYGAFSCNHSNIPNGWKKGTKCRKQWAKNIENPSYEKLSSAIWKYELDSIEDVS